MEDSRLRRNRFCGFSTQPGRRYWLRHRKSDYAVTPNRALLASTFHGHFLLSHIAVSTRKGASRLRPVGRPGAVRDPLAPWHSGAPCTPPRSSTGAELNSLRPSRRMSASDSRGIFTGTRARSTLRSPQARYRASRRPWSAPVLHPLTRISCARGVSAAAIFLSVWRHA